MQFSNLQKKENGLIYKNGFFKQKYPYYWSSRWFRFRSLKAFSEKANLFLLDIDHKKLIKNNIPNAKNIECDLSKIDNLEKLFLNLSKEQKSIDILIHNAAILIQNHLKILTKNIGMMYLIFP